MKLSKKQKEVIALMRDGYTFKHSVGFGRSWWIIKTLDGGYVHSESILRATWDKLCEGKFIRYSHTDAFHHKIFVLTELGESIKID